jgi:uncharacterized SAM-dependent methyltransferase
MSPDDYLLIGFDLVKDEQILKKAYNDASGVTAQFNLNLLRRINRELDGEFILDNFEHQAIYNDKKERIELYLVSLKDQDVWIEALDQTYRFGQNERIHTENSHKYTQDAIVKLAAESGLRVTGQWFDTNHYFCSTLFTPI